MLFPRYKDYRKGQWRGIEKILPKLEFPRSFWVTEVWSSQRVKQQRGWDFKYKSLEHRTQTWSWSKWLLTQGAAIMLSINSSSWSSISWFSKFLSLDLTFLISKMWVGDGGRVGSEIHEYILWVHMSNNAKLCDSAGYLSALRQQRIIKRVKEMVTLGECAGSWGLINSI